MSDQPDERNGAVDEASEAPESETTEPAWPQPTEGPAWSELADAIESSGTAAAQIDPSLESPPEEALSEGSRARRPTSLRPSGPTSDAPWRKLTPSSFPSAPAVPGSPVQPPVSEPEEAGRSADVPSASPSLREKIQSGASLRSTMQTASSLRQRLPAGSSSLRASVQSSRGAVDKLPVDQFKSLVKRRPEVGLGAAFGGGLVIATLLKRLGRR